MNQVDPFWLPETPDVAPELLAAVRDDYERLARDGGPPRIEEYLAERYRLDVGAEYATPWALNTLEELIFDRYEERAMTLLTSNRNLKAMADHQGDRYGRLVDRLGDVSRPVYIEVEGSSWRERPRKAVEA